MEYLCNITAHNQCNIGFGTNSDRFILILQAGRDGSKNSFALGSLTLTLFRILFVFEGAAPLKFVLDLEFTLTLHGLSFEFIFRSNLLALTFTLGFCS